jgi:transposase
MGMEEAWAEGTASLMATSLRLVEPWYVVEERFDEQLDAVGITVSVRKKAQFPCPKCGGETSRFGYEPKLRMWRHGDCAFHACLVGCRRPRVVCPDCGVSLVHAPFERKNSRFTLPFEGYAMMLMKDMPIASAARTLRCNEKSLTSILHYWVFDAVEKQDLGSVHCIAMDETSFKRGHSYVTVVVNSENRRVIDVEKGRDKEAVKAFSGKLLERGGHPDSIEIVTSDMSKSFMPAIAEEFQNAVNVIDKFHVKKVLIDAMETVRREEQKEQLKKTKKRCSKADV